MKKDEITSISKRFEISKRETTWLYGPQGQVILLRRKPYGFQQKPEVSNEPR